MGEFLAEFAIELFGELFELSIGLFLHSEKVARWVKTLVMSVLAGIVVCALGIGAVCAWRSEQSAVLAAVVGLLAAAAGVGSAAAIVRGNRRNWVPKEKKNKTRRKRYEP